MAKNSKDIIGVGRRKTAVSAVRLRPGSGKIDVNGREMNDYFPSETQREHILDPLVKAKSEGKFDIIIRAKGGGLMAQATATRLGLSRALVSKDETLRKDLKELGYLTRDPRKKERKKYGQKGARASFQFSKR